MNAEPVPVTPAFESAQKFCTEFTTRQRAHWSAEAEKRREMARDWNWASDIGEPCARRLFYERTRSERAEIPSPELACLFEQGHLHEPHVIAFLAKMGWRLLGEQRRIRSAFDRISVKPEGYIEIEPGLQVLGEVKAISSYSWDRYNTYEDLRDSIPYGRNWYAQLQTGMYMGGVEAAVILLKSKQDGWIKAIAVPFDADAFDPILRKLELVNAGVELAEPPPFIDDPVECERCPWRDRVCLPPCGVSGGMVVITAGEAIEAADYVHRYGEIGKRVEEAKKTVKTYAKATFASILIEPKKKQKFTAIIGKLVIRLSDCGRAGYSMPATEYRQAKIDSDS